jgi:hypothetical protein
VKGLILLLLLALQATAVAPGEWIFLASDADSRWQDAIGIFYTQDTSLVIYDTTISARRVAFESYDPSDRQNCPMSAFGYYDCTMRRAFRSYPIVSTCDSFVKIIYNVNTGKCGWLRVTDRTEIIMLSDTMAFYGREVIYLAAIGAKYCQTVAHYDEPSGELIGYDTIVPLNPADLQEGILPEYKKLPKKAYEDMISIRGYGWKNLSLGTIAKIKGDWAQLGSWDYEELILKPTDRWIRIRDNQGRFLVWFVHVVRY